MIHHLIIRRTAKRQIDKAFRWYAAQSPKLGEDFLGALETMLARLGDTPLLYAAVYQNIRRALLPRFPYGVFYFTQHERMVVVAVLHTSRTPKLWPSSY